MGSASLRSWSPLGMLGSITGLLALAQRAPSRDVPPHTPPGRSTWRSPIRHRAAPLSRHGACDRPRCRDLWYHRWRSFRRLLPLAGQLRRRTHRLRLLGVHRRRPADAKHNAARVHASVPDGHFGRPTQQDRAPTAASPGAGAGAPRRSSTCAAANAAPRRYNDSTRPASRSRSHTSPASAICSATSAAASRPQTQGLLPAAPGRMFGYTVRWASSRWGGTTHE